ncbi:MAG: hypothetical protein Q9166_007011 [cf. Caloplaca sp. 2 TL-2023]
MKRGDYAPVRPSDLRSPCPAIKALANHDYLPRDGRNVHASEILNGMIQLGLACLNLNQFVLHNIVEHHVSMTRRDFAQRDNNTPQADLIDDLLASSSNGKTITIDDFVGLRRRRYESEEVENPKFEF